MKRLLLLRHAKTEQANKDTPADFSRALTERGRADAVAMGQQLAGKAYLPDLILCSPSARTRQTLELVNRELRSPSECRYVDAIYAAGARQLLSLLQALQDKADMVMVVGHNPALEDSLGLLTREATTPRVFPPAAVAVIDFDISAWREIAPCTGALAELLRPKN
ncbi:MAG: histidine phosphatase family protein [Alphaproteobacteria bacterium]|nr:histidine phosphatase family protein [Alphaproteobacteria bacterium]